MTKLFKFLMPMVLIAFLTTLNVVVGLDGGVQDENAGSNFEYLALASGIALATIVLLPEMQQIKRVHKYDDLLGSFFDFQHSDFRPYHPLTTVSQFHGEPPVYHDGLPIAVHG